MHGGCGGRSGQDRGPAVMRVVRMACRGRGREVEVVSEAAARRGVRDRADGVRADRGHAAVQARVVAGGQGAAVRGRGGDDHAAPAGRMIEAVGRGMRREFVVRWGWSLAGRGIKPGRVWLLFVMEAVVLAVDIF